MRKPNFLGIGGQKCGTTWLYHYLRSHPAAYVPPRLKELAYFDVEERYNQLGDDGYLDYFKDASDQIAVGEITPTYLWSGSNHSEWGAPGEFRRSTPERVRSLLGDDLKFVVLIRNPIQRTVSAFLHHMKKDRIGKDEAIEAWLKRFGISHMGLWAEHLARWTSVFSKEQFIVATYEDLFSKEKTLVDILDFIGLRPASHLSDRREKFFQTTYSYRRDGDRFVFDSGEVIASPEDLSLMRSIFADDVNRLKEDWGFPEDLWEVDF